MRIFASVIVLAACWNQASATRAHEFVKQNEKAEPDQHLLTKAYNLRTLLLVPTSQWVSGHSEFIEYLKNHHHQITVTPFSSKTDVAVLTGNDELLYDLVVVADIDQEYANAPGNKAVSGAISQLSKSLLHALQEHQGFNIFFLGLADHLASQHLWGELSSQLGIQFPSQLNREKVKDLQYLYGNGHSYSDGRRVPDVTAIVSDPTLVLGFDGYSHQLDPTNQLLFPIYVGGPTAFVPGASNNAIVDSGTRLTLVSGLQTRHNNRVVFTRSSSICSNRAYADRPDNRGICEELSHWVAKQKSVVEWSSLRHYQVNPNPRQYYKKNEPLELSLNLVELDYAQRKWVEFSHIETTQLEYHRLSPFLRMFLTRSANRDAHGVSNAIAQFKAPNQSGTFKFVIYNYIKGYTFLHLETVAPVRNVEKNELVKILRVAFPFYLGMVASLVSAVALTVALIHGGPWTKNQKLD